MYTCVEFLLSLTPRPPCVSPSLTPPGRPFKPSAFFEVDKVLASVVGGKIVKRNFASGEVALGVSILSVVEAFGELIGVGNDLGVEATGVRGGESRAGLRGEVIDVPTLKYTELAELEDVEEYDEE
ncbi:hypothetical protein MD484_g387, partial [Candolleomyces efflorescens]